MTRPSYARWLEWTPEKTTDKTDKIPAELSSVGFVGSKRRSAQKKTAPTPGPEHNSEPVAAPAPVSGSPWPPECLASERKFRIPAAKLYPLLDHKVLTPAGAGILLQVFSDRVQVHLKGEPRTREFHPEEIAVAADVQQAREAKPC